MPTCLLVQPIHQSGVDLLERSGITVRYASSRHMEVVAREVNGCDAVITRDAGFSAVALEASDKLRVLANHGVGMDKIDVPSVTARHIPIVFTPDANARSTAEHAIALALAVAKRVLINDTGVRTGNWGIQYEPGHRQLFGKTFGVVGFGSIGRMAAAIAGKGFGMRVLVYSPSTDIEVFRSEGVEVAASLNDLLSASDIISLHRPSRPDTRHMIDAEAFASMKPTAILVNTARGALIDSNAMVAALRTGRIAGAGLDVFEEEPLPSRSPLLSMKTVVLSPHVGGSTDEALQATAELCARQIVQVLNGERPDHLVNPAIWDSRGVPPL